MIAGKLSTERRVLIPQALGLHCCHVEASERDQSRGMAVALQVSGESPTCWWRGGKDCLAAAVEEEVLVEVARLNEGSTRGGTYKKCYLK